MLVIVFLCVGKSVFVSRTLPLFVTLSGVSQERLSSLHTPATFLFAVNTVHGSGSEGVRGVVHGSRMVEAGKHKA